MEQFNKNKNKKIKKILWFTWKDKKNPYAGGAEVVNTELAKRLVNEGYDVTFIVRGYNGCKADEIIDGYRVIRLGNWKTVYWQAYKYYKKHLVGWADLVIDEVNTLPFFCKFYVKEKNILFIHQLCRKIWFYQIAFPLCAIGCFLEPIYLWLLSGRKVITVSNSSKRDLLRYGFKERNIRLISEGIEILPVQDLNSIKKFQNPTILAHGSIKAMKRTDHIITAFEIAKEKIEDLKLIISGAPEGRYGAKVLDMIMNSKYHDSIEYLGRVSDEKKIELMQKSHLIALTSIKEGWGIVVTEANSQGTPAVVYNVDGLRDSTRNNLTGLVSKHNTPIALAERIVELLSDKKKYTKLQKAGWEWSKEINFENSFKDFINAINNS